MTDTILTYKTKERTFTQRGVLWIGKRCDISCLFCYIRFLDKKDRIWEPIDGAGGVKEIARVFKDKYKNRFVDFMGGEPTIYPHIYKLIEYCSEINLFPTCITHGLHLADIAQVQRFKDSGIQEFLISIHGLREINDKLLGGRIMDSSKKQIKGLENCKALGIPFRFNVTLTDWNKEQLIEIAQLGIDFGAVAINWITFNPYFEWQSKNFIDFQAKHSSIAPYLKKAIDLCIENDIETNVRYMPICQLKGYERHIYNGYQLPYDHHEWDYNSWFDCNIKEPSADWYYKAAQIQQQRNGYTYGNVCNECAVKNICDGFHQQYATRYGYSEANPYEGKIIFDPTFFIKEQMKFQYNV